MDLFVPAIWMVSGISLFAGVHFTLTGLRRGQGPGFLPFGLLCLTLAAYMALDAQFYLAQNVDAADQIDRYKIMCLCLIYPLMVWFIGEFTGLQKLRPWLVTAVLLFGTLLVLNAFSPESLLIFRLSDR